jgi:DNA polymerase I-like protein with 3'-5' exonuclease and polymerase domains
VQYEKADFIYMLDGTKLDSADWDTLTGDEQVVCLTKHGGAVTYKSGKNKGQIKLHRDDTTIEKMKWDEDGRYKFPGIIKFADMPDVLRDKYTGKRAEFQQARALPDGTPVYSTSGDSLKALDTFGFEQAKMLMRAATLEKDNGAFYITHEYDKDGNVKKSKGMLQYVGEDGIIHHNLNQCATGTTRLSSSNPNLQQLPKVDEDNPMAGSRVKEMFISRFGLDGSIGEVDYTALEVVWCAALSGDKNLLALLMSNTDMHLYRLAGKVNNWNGFTFDDLVKIKKDEDHEWHGRVMKARSAIKPKAFSAQYGASAGGIAFNTGCTIEEAQAFLDNEAALFPQSIKFRQTVRDQVELTGGTMEGLCREQTEFGWTVYRRGYYQAPGGTCYSFRQYPKWDRDTRQTIMDYKDTQIANYWNQGEAGFMMTVSMGRIARWMIARPQFMVTEFLINNVHDAAYTDCRNDTQLEVNLAVRAILEDAPKYMSEQLGYDIADIPFPAVAESGSSMFNKKRLH